MSGIFEILGVIALIAIIFGVSMHEAFWGIASFIFGVILLSIVALFLVAGFCAGKNKMSQWVNKSRHRLTEKEKIQRKKAWQFDIGGTILLIWLFSPFMLVVLFGTILKDFAEQNSWVIIVAFLPYILPLSLVLLGWVSSEIRSIIHPQIVKKSKKHSAWAIIGGWIAYILVSYIITAFFLAMINFHTWPFVILIPFIPTAIRLIFAILRTCSIHIAKKRVHN